MTTVTLPYERFEALLNMERRACDLKDALDQVDDVLVTNWIAVEDGDWRGGLAKLVQQGIQEHEYFELDKVNAELEHFKEELASIKADVLAAEGEIDRLTKREAFLLEANNLELEKRRRAEADVREEAARGDAWRGVALGAENPLVSYLERQIDWSSRTFGPGLRTKGLTAHIRKELAEIEANPRDLSEYIDVIILAMDGYWRHGGKPDSLLGDLRAKQDRNFRRVWPAPTSEDEPVEHDRSVSA